MTSAEIDLLQWLLGKERPDRIPAIDGLKVHARCGCGKCPTIMFSSTPEQEKQILADYIGTNDRGHLVGVILWSHNDELIELEAWSVDGHDVIDWPPLDSLRQFEARRAEPERGAYG